MKARDAVVTFGIGVAASLLVALVIEALRSKGALPVAPPAPALPTPVAPGADHV